VNLHRLFSITYSVSRENSDLWWCADRKIWTTLDDNQGVLSNSTEQVSKRAVSKYIESIPETEAIFILRIMFIFGIRVMTAFKSRGQNETD